MLNVTVRNNRGVDIKEDMIGLFFEDINYAGDGGLYCEMIENYNFEAIMTTGDRDNYKPVYDGLYGWEAYPYDGAGAMLETLCEDGVSRANPHYLTFTASEEQPGFSNKAYDGVYLSEGEEYRISLYARKKPGYKGGVTAVIDFFGEIIQNINIADTLTDEWKKYEITFKAEETVNAGTFAILLTEPGRVEFDFISLKPANAVCGVFRRDLAEKLKELKPGFLRFPGGCVVEGNTLENRYRWKKSVGKPEERRNNWNRWAVHENKPENNFISEYCHYNQTLGMGYYEYFLLCEYLECKPLPVANVGTACQFMSSEHVNIDDEKFNEYIQDVLDLIEFANGDTDSKWGAVRANMGHPEPFKLEMIGVGNEQWETENFDFFKRYELFEKAIHNHYPDMKLIGSAGPFVQEQHYNDAWNFYRGKIEEYKEDISRFVYAVDEHYYQKPEWMLENSHFYDDYPRDIKVFAGEYATHIVPGSFNNPSSNSLYAALTEGAFLTGVERNADVVVLASYAPLFARVGYTQWSPDMIWFDGKDSYKTPSYYVQKFYSVYTGKYTVEIHVPDEIYGTATYDDNAKKLYVKLVNTSEEAVDLKLNLEGFENFRNATEVILADDDRECYNSLDDMERIVPVENQIPVPSEYTLRKNSFTVLILS